LVVTLRFAKFCFVNFASKFTFLILILQMKPTLVILAAGMASRYGSMKQTQGFGPFGETIMEYSIYDAIRAGFKKVVFIIREDFAEPFKAAIEPKLRGKIETAYTFQSLTSYLGGLALPENRVKPWGTAHAVLCAKTAVNDPFAVINADDFYGADAFKKACDFLMTSCSETKNCLIGYKLVNTLSEHGTVSRGVCTVDENNNLVSIKERTKIYKDNSGIVFEDEEGVHQADTHASVSMNFWCFHPSLFAITEKLFHSFVKENSSNLKAEFFIPILAEAFMEKHGGQIAVIPCSSSWFGVTYKEDAPVVKASIDALVEKGVYPKSLW
jgi:NDP-sugar pyrophosphorylase family protein